MNPFPSLLTSLLLGRPRARNKGSITGLNLENLNNKTERKKMNCINTKCRKQIPDGSRFCQFCGKDQSGRQPAEKLGVRLITCQHCEGTGECNKGKTADKIHSCEYCFSKSGVKANSLFPHVPCVYCQGVGKRIIDLKVQKEVKQDQNQGGKYGRRQT